MKFRSRSDNQVVRLASTTGHICLVGREFVEIPEHMEAEAYANGCVSEELYNAIKADLAAGNLVAGGGVRLPGNGGPQAERTSVIKQQIEAMLDSGEDGAFTAAGLPNLKVLSGKCGFQVGKDEMETVWGAIAAGKEQDGEGD